jgi:UrcA family protein
MTFKILMGCCLVAVTQAHAADNLTVLRETVYVGDLRQDTPAGLAALYARVEAAAERVCEPLQTVGGRLQFEYTRCRHEAVERAVAQFPALVNCDHRKHKPRNG